MNSQERFEAMLMAMVGDDTSEPLDFCDAFELGRLDALDGKSCRSGQYEGLLDQAQYALGYDSVENTLELESWIEDVEWMRSGC